MVLIQIVREVMVFSEGGTARCRRSWVRVEDNFRFLLAVHQVIFTFNLTLKRL